MTMLVAVVLAASGTMVGEILYRDDIKPLFDAHCVECHHAGGRSPDLSRFPFVALDGADQETIVARIIARIVSQGGAPARMPPGAREKLNASEVMTVRDWLAQGLESEESLHED